MTTSLHSLNIFTTQGRESWPSFFSLCSPPSLEQSRHPPVAVVLTALQASRRRRGQTFRMPSPGSNSDAAGAPGGLETLLVEASPAVCKQGGGHQPRWQRGPESGDRAVAEGNQAGGQGTGRSPTGPGMRGHCSSAPGAFPLNSPPRLLSRRSPFSGNGPSGRAPPCSRSCPLGSTSLREGLAGQRGV